jgi:hypothetical protein
VSASLRRRWKDVSPDSRFHPLVERKGYLRAFERGKFYITHLLLQPVQPAELRLVIKEVIPNERFRAAFLYRNFGRQSIRRRQFCRGGHFSLQPQPTYTASTATSYSMSTCGGAVMGA